MSSRPPATAADYMVVALSPTLIFLLVGSLCFFLVEVFYQGDYPHRLLFVMAMFVMGIVALSRLAMEEGWAYAFLYAVLLAAVVAIALATFVKIQGPLAPFGFFINIGLMGLIWWSSYKLVWDCTLIDEDQDSSGEGLLQAVGLDASASESNSTASESASGNDPPVEGASAEHDAVSSGEDDATPEARMFAWVQKLFAPDRRPHAPGKWVIYFSLAALPLFGLGQWFIPVEKLGSRRFAFWMMAIYVASGMLLLLNTSFLGLRRYLRQRRLSMPLDMAVTWLTVGTLMVAALLALVYLLPSPSPEYSISQLDIFKSRNYDSSRYSPGGPDGSEKGESQQKAEKEGTEQQGGENPEDKSGGDKSGDQSGKNNSGQSSTSESQGAKSGDKSAGKQQGKSPEKSQGEQGEKGDDQKGGKTQSHNQSSPNQQQSRQGGKSESPSKSQAQRENQDTKSNQTSNQTSNQGKPPPRRPPPSPSQLLSRIPSALGTLLKWLFYAALIIAALVTAWIYRKELVAAWNKLLAELRDLWARWFGTKSQGELAAAAVLAAPPRTFASYSDPFASGMAARVNLPELVRYSFEALEAWGRDHGSPRATGQTPHEFTQQLGDLDNTVSREVKQLADLYCQIAYARSLPAGGIELVQAFWNRMLARR